MPVQTAYTIGQDAAFEGQLIDLQPSWVKNYTAEAAIPFGRGVIQGTTDGEALLAAAEGTLIGVSALSSVGADGTTTAAYAANDTASIVDFGRVWVKAVGAVTKNAPAYVITTVGATQGQFTATPNALGSIGKFATGGTDTLVQLDVSLALKGEQGEQGEPGEPG